MVVMGEGGVVDGDAVLLLDQMDPLMECFSGPLLQNIFGYEPVDLVIRKLLPGFGPLLALKSTCPQVAKDNRTYSPLLEA